MTYNIRNKKNQGLTFSLKVTIGEGQKKRIKVTFKQFRVKDNNYKENWAKIRLLSLKNGSVNIYFLQ